MIDVRRSAERATTTADGVVARHSFSFGAHYDPANTGFGALVASNEETLSQGRGYDTHRHTGVEIVTWVVAGSLRHEDTLGGVAELAAGTVQRVSAGSGVRHAEHGGAPRSTRFVQMWLQPDDPDSEPSYDRAPVPSGPGLVPLASGVRGVTAPVRVGTAGAVLHLARLAAGEQVRLPDAPRRHVYVTGGSADLEGAGQLLEGDAARLTGEAGPLLTGRSRTAVLVWQLP